MSVISIKLWHIVFCINFWSEQMQNMCFSGFGKSVKINGKTSEKNLKNLKTITVTVTVNHCHWTCTISSSLSLWLL